MSLIMKHSRKVLNIRIKLQFTANKHYSGKFYTNAD